MKELEIGIDVDDVTAKFRQRIVDVANELFGWDKQLEDCTSTFEVEKAMNLTKTQNAKLWVEVNKRGYAQTLDVMEGAAAAIDALARRHNVYFVTSPLKSSETWVHDRTKWIRRHFGQTLSNSIIYTKRKHMVDVDVLIDDNVEILKKWADKRLERSDGQREIYPVVYHWPYNAGAFHLRRYVSWRIIGGAFGC